jgi:ABC-2 type transport system permease protein
VTLWRLEWLRLARTRRWIALLAVYLFFALTGPALARYAATLVERLGAGQVRVTIPPPVPADGITQYAKNVTQIGLVVVVVIAASALAFDARPEVGVFFRTRVRRVADLLWPRYAVSAAAAVAAFVIGSLAAWYETVILLGGLPAGAMLAGIGFGALYLAFAVAVVALCAAATRSVLGAVMAALAVLIAMPIVGLLHGVEPWMPSTLVGALDGVVRGSPASDYSRAAGVALVAGASALWGSTRLAGRREL